MTSASPALTLVPMKETKAVGRLWDLVQNYLDHQDFKVSERQLAMKLGYSSSSTFEGWKAPKSLPSAQGLARFAALSRLPYQRVLDAALEDSGYLPQPTLTSEPLGIPRRRSTDLTAEPEVVEIGTRRRQVEADRDDAAARDLGEPSPGQQRRRRADRAGEPAVDDPEDLEPR